MDADGAHQRRLTAWAGRDLDPAWSPDGQKITFDREIAPITDHVREQFVMSADGTSEPIQLTAPPSENGHGVSW